jgi:hypothetical protein
MSCSHVLRPPPFFYALLASEFPRTPLTGNSVNRANLLLVLRAIPRTANGKNLQRVCFRSDRTVPVSGGSRCRGEIEAFREVADSRKSVSRRCRLAPCLIVRSRWR